MQKIAVYNNATGIAGKLEFLCRGEQIEIVVEKTKEKLLEDVVRRSVSMVLLDVFMEAQGLGEGLRLIAEVRKTCKMPIIVVSDQTSDTAKVAALSIGADDFVNADDNPLVTMARIKSQHRRYVQLTGTRPRPAENMYRIDGLVIYDDQRKVTVEGREVYLTPTEYEILKLLVMEQGKVLSIPKIYEDIWQMQAVDVDNTVAVHVRHIREKIEANPRKPKYLKVIWGTGYMVG